MRQSKLNLKARQSGPLPKFAAVAILLLAGIPATSRAQQPGQKTFATAEEASSTLAAATEAGDGTAMLAIFGPDGKQVVYSGDEVQDREMHANFAKKYVEMHRLVNEPDGTTTLYIGAENWPAPRRPARCWPPRRKRRFSGPAAGPWKWQECQPTIK